MTNPWILCGIGIFFCATGVYLFFKNAFEEDQTLYWPVVIMIMGVILISIGTAKYFKLIN